jgi:hypothetical protein
LDKEVSEFLSEKNEFLEASETEEDAIHFFLNLIGNSPSRADRESDWNA